MVKGEGGPKGPRPRSGWVPSTQRHTVAVLVRCSPELAERARRVARERGVTLAEVLQRGVEEDKIMKLAKDCWAVGIHSVTGRPIDEGTLEAGTLVRNVRRYDRDQSWFEASTDGGVTWHLQRGETPVTEELR